MPTLTAVYCGWAFRCGAAGAATGVMLRFVAASAELFNGEAGGDGAFTDTDGLNAGGIVATGEVFATPGDSSEEC